MPDKKSRIQAVINFDEKEQEEKESKQNAEIKQLSEKFRNIDKTKILIKMKEIILDVDDDDNFHVDYLTTVINARARNYKIREVSRFECKTSVGKIIARLPTTISVICGLMQLEFYKLNLGLKYVKQNSFYNANINLAMSQFQFFEPDVAIQHVDREEYDAVFCCDLKHVAYPPRWTSWDKLVINEGNLTVQEFIDLFPKIFNGITVDLLHKYGKMRKGRLIWHNSNAKKDAIKTQKLIDRYVELYGELLSNKRNYVLLHGEFVLENGDVDVDLPKIQYFFK
eukprot:485102_1